MITYAQILYECNFDTAAIGTGCLAPVGTFGLLIVDKMGTAGIQAPTTPLSDVTSSRKNNYFFFTMSIFCHLLFFSQTNNEW